MRGGCIYDEEREDRGRYVNTAMQNSHFILNIMGVSGRFWGKVCLLPEKIREEQEKKKEKTARTHNGSGKL